MQLLGSEFKSDLHDKVLPPKSLIIAYSGISVGDLLSRYEKSCIH